MLTLSLLRHAKSSWDVPGQDDRARPLNDRGLKDAPRMGQFLRQQGLIPELILCSNAARTRATMDLVVAEFGDARPKMEIAPALYLAEPDAILRAVKSLDATCRQVLVIGHNPGLHDLALELARPSRSKAYDALSTKFPTCGLAVVEFEVAGWDKVGPRLGRLAQFTAPKLL